MDKNKQETEEWFKLTMHEVTCSFGVDTALIEEIINEGIVTVKKNKKNQVQFDEEAIRRIRTVIRLNRDLGVNVAGAGLALELIKEIEELKAIINQEN